MRFVRTWYCRASLSGRYHSDHQLRLYMKSRSTQTKPRIRRMGSRMYRDERAHGASTTRGDRHGPSHRVRLGAYSWSWTAIKLRSTSPRSGRTRLWRMHRGESLNASSPAGFRGCSPNGRRRQSELHPSYTGTSLTREAITVRLGRSPRPACVEGCALSCLCLPVCSRIGY